MQPPIPPIQDRNQAIRVRQDRQRGNLQLRIPILLQRLHDRSRQIRATTHRLSDNHVGRGFGTNLLDRIRESVKITAETTATYLGNPQIRQLQQLAVHKFRSLVVRNQTYTQPFIHQSHGSFP